MSEELNPGLYEAVFQTIAEVIQQLPEEQRRKISAQLGDYTHDFKHLLGLVTGANSVLLRSAPADEIGSQIVEMVEISDSAAAQLNELIEVIVKQLYLTTRLEED